MKKYIFIILTVFIAILVSTEGDAQEKNRIAPLKNSEQIKFYEQRIKEYFKCQEFPRQVRPDYPIQDFYHLSFLVGNNTSKIEPSDTTPPTEPSTLLVHKEGIHSIYLEWTASDDPESGISSYTFGIGASSGLADVRWWAALAGNSTKTYAVSMAELGVQEGDTIFITVYASNGVGLESNHISSSPIILEWEELGNLQNELTVEYSTYGFDSTGSNVISGWDSSQIQLLEHFISRMLPIIKDIYGPPSHSYTVTLIKNMYYNNSNIFFPSANEIHMDTTIYWQLLTHELIHAFRDNVTLSMDSIWHYHPKLSGFEESFAQGVSYVCMNHYVELYPADILVDSTYLFGSSMDWDYDFRNDSLITTEDLWSDYGGTGISWERYELGAAAMKKIHLEDSAVFKKFNLEYYQRLNADHQLTPSRQLCIDLFSSKVTTVEGFDSDIWFNKQRIFDCTIRPGKKIWINTQHYPNWDKYIIFQRIFYYETFTNGSEWGYWDDSTGDWIYHNLNGSSGVGSVRTFSDSLFHQKNLLIEPTTNPPFYYGLGYDAVNFSTDNDTDPWPGGDTENYVLNMIPFGLYHFDVSFDSVNTRFYRVIGQELNNTTGIFGGVLNSKGGQIFIDHENYPDEPPLNIVNGAFWGTRQWASVPNINTGYADSEPGRVFIKYVDSLGNEYAATRNIDYGSWSGNQLFLFDVNNMFPLYNSVGKEYDINNSLTVYPNPVSNVLNIDFYNSKSGMISLNILDINGRQIGNLVNKHLDAGNYKFQFSTEQLSDGIYLLQTRSDNTSFVKKWILLRDDNIK